MQHHEFFLASVLFFKALFFHPLPLILVFSLPPSFPVDEGSEPSSGRDTPASSSSRQGVDQTEEKSKKDKKKKEKTKKKEKSKEKGKDKEKKKADEPEETEKKSKKIGFGRLR